MSHLSLGQCSGFIEGRGCAVEFLELLELEAVREGVSAGVLVRACACACSSGAVVQLAGSLCRLRVLSKVLALQQLLVLGLEERITSAGLGEDEKRHLVVAAVAQLLVGGKVKSRDLRMAGLVDLATVTMPLL